VREGTAYLTCDINNGQVPTTSQPCELGAVAYDAIVSCTSQHAFRCACTLAFMQAPLFCSRTLSSLKPLSSFIAPFAHLLTQDGDITSRVLLCPPPDCAKQQSCGGENGRPLQEQKLSGV
jgi:hypothetical protein